MSEYLWEFFLVLLAVSLAFIAERLWECWQDRKNFNSLKEQVVDEIKYNCTPGVGSPECPFNLDAHKELRKNNQLNKEIKALLDKLIQAAQLCNSYGGKQNLKINNGGVKSLSEELKLKLSF